MKQIIPGFVFIALGLVLAALPFWILPVCDHGVATAAGGETPMRCRWTARAELGLGLLVAFGGVAHCLFRQSAVRLGIALMQAGAAALALLLPFALIPVCAGAKMACHIGTRPGLAVVAALILLWALGSVASGLRALRPSGASA